MENASKALIFVASTLIAIMLMAFMVYTFRRFGTTARNTEKRWSDQEIEAFNSKFLSYDTGGTYSLNDIISFTEARKFNASGIEEASSTKSYKYSQVFANPRQITNDDYYKRSLIAVSQSLNTGYDVVTAINDAIDINDKNNNGYRYNQLELQNSVEIIIDLGSYKNDFTFNKAFRYLIIEPNRNVKSRHIYGTNSITSSGTNETNKKSNSELDVFKSNNEISVYDMLDELRSTKVINQDSKSYTVYKYYFFGQIIFNDFTGKIETVKFTLVKDKNF